MSRFFWLACLTMLSLSSVAYGQDSMKFPVDENPRYFPVGVFAVGKGDGVFTAGWYAEQLRALKEPSLLMDASAHKETVYRFTWLRTFNHPIAVRIVIHANGTGTLTSKMADGAGGYKPGKLITNTTRDIGASEVQHLLASIDAMGFWRMPAEDNTVLGLDGAEWIFEGYDGGTYHVISRWSPKDGPVRDLGLYLVLTLAKLEVGPKEIY